MAHLICDDREREGSPVDFITLSSTKIENLALGDYAIASGEIIHCLFERKTWRDLAASIKDGRYEEQKKRLIELNAKGEIKCFYIIEGKLSYDPDREFGHVKFSTLESAKRSILISGIPVIQCESAEKTMDFLEKFLADFEEKVLKVRDSSEVRGGARSQLKAPEKTIADYKKEFLSEAFSPKVLHCFDDISIKSVCSYFLFDRPYAEDFVKKLAYLNKRKLSAKRVQKICDAFFNNQASLLAALPGFSKASAEFVCKTCSFLELTQLEASKIAEIKKTEKTKIGHVLAAKFVKIVTL